MSGLHPPSHLIPTNNHTTIHNGTNGGQSAKMASGTGAGAQMQEPSTNTPSTPMPAHQHDLDYISSNVDGRDVFLIGTNATNFIQQETLSAQPAQAMSPPQRALDNGVSNVDKTALVPMGTGISKADDTLLSDQMGCEIIVIGIGAGPTKFTVHANLLCLASKKLAEWIKQPLAEGQKFRSLPAEDPDTFKLLIEVLYSRRVPSVAPSTIREAQRARTLKLCQLYCFMERYGVNVNFMNLTMDKIQDGFAILRTYPDVKLIAAINQHSGPASQLRKFCAHSVLFWMYSAEYKDNHTLVHLLHGKAFANSFIDALRAANAEHYITSVDPRIRDCGRDNQCAECGGNWSKLFGKAGMKPCYFHVHPDETKGADGKHPSCHLWKA